ncbi:U-box domain-containing protein 42 [Dorcoceras hygrometricum]|uniref:RING-type E3 ubiquitin transferase n=1 Tax=Dorcoceras hygrometricum TaxID=472368 RepID=A0A2Z7CRV3_9LAMI|nr:U-box domain-containing protein 42 [Dorcoceras hygrometricum]
MFVGHKNSYESHSREETNLNGILGGALLRAISEILKSLLCIETEKEIFIEIGCYFYRASMVIMELQINRNTPANAIEILQSLSRRVESAKSFTAQIEKNAQKMVVSDVQNVVHHIESAVRNIGENLSILPSLTYGSQDYVERAAKALSEEMKDASFLGRLGQNSEMKQRHHHVLSSGDFKRGERKQIDEDLYSVDVEVSAANIPFSETSQTYVSDTLESSPMVNGNVSKGSSAGSSLTALPQFAHMEPLYETFFCPLSKTVMEDPVTLDSGVTYERKEITEWLERQEDSEEIFCPKSGQKLKSKNLSANVALKATIDEWKERNEAARIKVARAALSLASSDNMVLEALIDMQTVCKTKAYNKVQVRNIGMIPLLGKCLQFRNRSVRCATLELLKQLAEDDENGKEVIAKTVDISVIIKMLSSGHKPIRHASVLALLELSTSKFLCGEIGSVAGGILMLITAKYRESSDAFTSEKANEILKNLELLPNNIKLMAENGYWEPLLTHLVEGSEEMRTEMASYLGEIVLGPDIKNYVAERASPALIKMVQNGKSLSRNAAFRALKQISCYHPNAAILVEAGIMLLMVDEMFTRTIHNETMNSKTEATAILANILESGLDVESFQVNAHGHTMASDYILYNIIIGIKNSTPDELNINLIRIVLCLIKFPKVSSTVVSVIKESEASYNLIELINNPNEEIGIASFKLLTILSSFMGHTLSDRLCKTRGQPESLIPNPDETTRITEKHAVSVNFLAKLPHKNLTLNLALVNGNVIPVIMKSISQTQVAGARSSRHAGTYFEGLVGILVRLTTTLYDHQILFTARTYNFASVFAELLTRSFSDEVQRLSAIGLENLSMQSISLSRPPQKKKTKFLKIVFSRKCISIKRSKGEEFSLCPVHRGVCSAQETFCLLDAEVVDQLLACLDHENVGVIEAALSALSTLLDDRVNVDQSISFLSEKRAIHHVLNVVKEHREEVLWQKAFWMIEKFLIEGREDSVSNISQDRLFPATLVSAFHHGDDRTRQMAEKILRHLNRIPNFANTVTFTM